MAEVKKDEKINGHGGMLSVVDLRDRIVPAKDLEKYLSLFEKRDWNGIITTFGENYERKFVIKDYNELNLTPFSYDLSIGHQVFSIQRPDPRVMPITEEHPYRMEPGETVLVITREYIALPPCYSATVWPRFKMVRSGIFQSMVKIDPTWYGKLAVAMSNLSPATLTIKRDEPFGTLVLYELSKPADVDLWKNDDLEEVDLALRNELEPWKQRLGDFLYNNTELQGHCRLAGNVLKIKGIKRSQLEELESFDRSNVWKEFVKEIGNKWAEAKDSKTGRRMIGMEGLGMMDLEPILQGATRGERVERKAIEIGCSQEELISAAIQYGKPFDLIANIPRLVAAQVDERVQSRLDREMGTNIIPRTIAIMLSVLGFLSLIIAVVGLIIRSFHSGLAFESDTTLMILLMIATGFIGIVLLFAVKMAFSLRHAPESVETVKQEILQLRNTFDKMLVECRKDCRGDLKILQEKVHSGKDNKGSGDMHIRK
jgi:deoxycytidine triphosphate deaminase